jgi:hypothetical protein
LEATKGKGTKITATGKTIGRKFCLLCRMLWALKTHGGIWNIEAIVQMKSDFITRIIEDGPLNSASARDREATANTLENSGGGQCKGKEILPVIANTATSSSVDTDGFVVGKFHQFHIMGGRGLPG